MSSKIRVKNEPMYKSQIEEVWQKRKRKKGVTLTTAMCQTKVQAIVEKYPYNLESLYSGIYMATRTLECPRLNFS